RPVAPRQDPGEDFHIRFLLQRHFIELFADGGKIYMCALIITKNRFTMLQITADEANTLDALQVKSIRQIARSSIIKSLGVLYKSISIFVFFVGWTICYYVSARRTTCLIPADYS